MTGRRLPFLNDHQLATALAALRLFQERGCPDNLEEIATDGYRFDLMRDEEVDELCELLKREPPATRRLAKPDQTRAVAAPLFALVRAGTYSPAFATAADRYEAAVNALGAATDQDSISSALAEMNAAKMDYGAQLLARDRRERPEIHAR